MYNEYVMEIRLFLILVIISRPLPDVKLDQIDKVRIHENVFGGDGIIGCIIGCYKQGFDSSRKIHCVS